MVIKEGRETGQQIRKLTFSRVIAFVFKKMGEVAMQKISI